MMMMVVVDVEGSSSKYAGLSCDKQPTRGSPSASGYENYIVVQSGIL
jgi:hypothetical protein